MTLNHSNSDWEDKVTQILKEHPHFSKVSSNISEPHSKAKNSIIITGDIKKYNTLYEQLPDSKYTTIDEGSDLNNNELGSGSENLILYRGYFTEFEFTKLEQQVLDLIVKDPPCNTYSGTAIFKNDTLFEIQHIDKPDIPKYLSFFEEHPLIVHNIIQENNSWSIQYRKSGEKGPNEQGFGYRRLYNLIDKQLRLNCPQCNTQKVYFDSFSQCYNHSTSKKHSFICINCHTAFIHTLQSPLYYLNALDPLSQLKKKYKQLFEKSLEKDTTLPQLPYTLFGTTEGITMFENPQKESDIYGNIEYWAYIDEQSPVIYYSLKELKEGLNKHKISFDYLEQCNICSKQFKQLYYISGAKYSPEYGHSDGGALVCSTCCDTLQNDAKQILGSRDDYYEIIASIF